MRLDKEIRRAIEKEVDFYANVGASVTFERTSKHNAAIISFRGESRRQIMPTTTANWRAIDNAVTDVRRKMRELGVFEAECPAPPVDEKTQADLVREARREHFRSRYFQPEIKPEVGTFGEALKEAGVAPSKPERPQRIPPPPVEDQPVIDLTPFVASPVASVPALPAPKTETPMETLTASTADIRVNGHAEAAQKRTPRGKYLTEEHRVKLTRLLILNGVQDEKNYQYHDGWSDEKVRDALDKDLPLDKIADYRRKFFGLTEAEQEKAKPHTLDSLKALVTKQAEQIQALIDRVKSLEETIAPLRA